LLQDLFPFFVHGTTRLKHNGSEVVIRIHERGSITVCFLSFSVRLTRLLRVEVRGSERVNNGHINREAAAETPVLDGDVSGSTTGLVSRTKDTKLLQLGREEADICEFEDEVPHVVVPRNSVAGLLAAEGVISI